MAAEILSSAGRRSNGMSNQQKHDPEEYSFGQMVAKGMRQVREERGACPGPETLIDFCHASLSTRESAIVEEHIAACGLCDLAVSRLRSADSHLAARPSILRTWVKPVFWNPIVAYGLAAALSYPAYLS